MKKILLAFICLQCTLLYAQPGLNWAKTISGAYSDHGEACAFDANGFNYTLAYTRNAAGEDMGNLTKRNAAGVTQWVRITGTDIHPRAMSFDASGNIYIVGTFMGTSDFNPGAAVNTLTSLGMDDGFLLKLDSNGDFVWVRSFGNPDYDEASAVKVDNAGNIILTGFFMGTVDFDPGAGTQDLTAVGYRDIFVQKINPSGNLIWVKQVGGNDADVATSIVVDANNDLILCGIYNETVDFNPAPAVNSMTSNGANDAFILKLASNGDYVWSKSIGGSGNEIAIDLVLGNSNDIYVAGGFSSTTDFDPGAGVQQLTPGATSDCFALKLNASGDFVWVRRFMTSGTGQGRAITVDNDDNVYFGGFYQGTLDADPGTGTNLLNSGGQNDYFLIKLDSNGSYNWGINSSANPAPQRELDDIAVNDEGDILVTGMFFGTVDFEYGPGVTQFTSAGGRDCFVLYLSPICTSTSVTADVASLADITATCSVNSLTAPIALTSCGDTITGTTTVSLPITTSGITIVTWTYNDGEGNTATQIQNVVISDNISPVAVTANLPDIIAQCSVTSLTAPTATDNCAGTITGTHNATLPITTQGSTLVTWAYNDGHGNTTVQTQNVIITDNMQPVAALANLPDITSPCSVTSLTAPTATDNCAGTINGTHNAALPITTQGTTTITWTYNDGHGNTAIQTQNVIISPVAVPTTTQSGATITVSTAGATYQWINCGNGNSPIAGATSQSYTATINGTYAVIVTQNGCSATSACVTISILGLEDVAQQEFQVYPNPNTGSFKVLTETQVEIRIMNTAGQTVFVKQLETGENTIDLTGIESGIYFISAINPAGQNAVQRVNILK